MEQVNAHTAVESLKGKRILITGGTTGIGRAITILLGSYGAKIITFGRHQEQLDEVISAVQQAGGEINGLIADSAKAEDIQRVFQQVDQTLVGLI
jgi:short-subunit dehydrogenase